MAYLFGQILIVWYEVANVVRHISTWPKVRRRYPGASQQEIKDHACLAVLTWLWPFLVGCSIAATCSPRIIAQVIRDTILITAHAFPFYDLVLCQIPRVGPYFKAQQLCFISSQSGTTDFSLAGGHEHPTQTVIAVHFGA